MELNIISFLPLLSKRWSNKKDSILYFIVQSLGSLIILVGGVLCDALIVWGLLLKGGLAPFHYWGVILAAKMSSFLAYMFLTWQKIAPLFILLQKSLLLVVVINSLVAVWRLRAKHVNVLLFYSGLLHVSWSLSANSYAYYIVYMIIMGPVFLGGSLPILLLNLAGIPPMTGFILKVTVLQLIPVVLGLFLVLVSVSLLCAYVRTFWHRPSKLDPLTVLVCSFGIFI